MTKKKTTKRRKPRRTFDAEKKNDILDYADEKGVAAAAKRYKVSQTVVYRWRKQAENGIGFFIADGPSPPATHGATDLMERAARDLFLTGYSISDISEVTTATEQEVEALLRQGLRGDAQ